MIPSDLAGSKQHQTAECLQFLAVIAAGSPASRQIWVGWQECGIHDCGGFQAGKNKVRSFHGDADHTRELHAGKPSEVILPSADPISRTFFSWKEDSPCNTVLYSRIPVHLLSVTNLHSENIIILSGKNQPGMKLGRARGLPDNHRSPRRKKPLENSPHLESIFGGCRLESVCTVSCERRKGYSWNFRTLPLWISPSLGWKWNPIKASAN